MLASDADYDELPLSPCSLVIIAILSQPVHNPLLMNAIGASTNSLKFNCLTN